MADNGAGAANGWLRAVATHILNLMVVRVAMSAYVYSKDPPLRLANPTQRLIAVNGIGAP